MKITKLVGSAEILGKERSISFSEFDGVMVIGNVTRGEFEKIVSVLEALEVAGRAVRATPAVPASSTVDTTSTTTLPPFVVQPTSVEVAPQTSGNGAHISLPPPSPGNIPPDVVAADSLRPVVDYVVHTLGKKVSDEIVAECVRMREAGSVPFLAGITGNFDKRVRGVAEAILQADDPKFA